MTEAEARPAGQTAGALLKAAREKQGVHVAALAAALKVAPRKLEALEADRYDELPDAAFVRALAQAMCRALRIDARPVLALLPRPDAASLEQVAGTLNTPFRDRGSRDDGGLAGAAIRPLLLVSALLMVAAVVLWLLPSSLWDETPPAAPAASAPAVAVEVLAPVPASAASASEAPASALPPAVPASVPTAPTALPTPAPAPAATATPAVTAPAPVAVPASAAAPGAAAAGALRLAATGTSWVEVLDARGQVVFSRTLQAGENAVVDGVGPLRLVIGNAGATSVVWRGRPVDLAEVARSNVARFELR